MEKIFSPSGSKHNNNGPVDAPNTLTSNTIGSFIDLLSEGEVEGLVNGSQSVFINNTPLNNPDGSTNFNGLTYTFLTGTPDQSYIPGFTLTSTPVQVGSALTHADPYTFVVTDTDFDRVVIGFQVDELVLTNKYGTKWTDVSLSIFVNGSQVITDDIQGKTETPFVKTYSVDISSATFPVEIRVVRNTPDSTDDDLVNGTTMAYYSQIIDKKFTYPNSCIVGISINASQFGTTVPDRYYLIKGIKCQIPSNYDPINRTYDGIWDGTFSTAWTNNPVWITYDVLTNKRYGLGTIIPNGFTNKFQAYTIAQYCDGLVPDGNGNYEPRYTFNGVINTSQEAETMIAQLCSTFRGFPYVLNGYLMIGADMPSDPCAIYTPANVIGGIFNYQTSPYNSRIAIANVTYNDPNNLYQETIETVEDPVIFNEIGYLSQDIQAIGCTSQGQAHRLAKWAIYTSNYQTETVTFSVGLEGLVRVPGDVILIQDPTIASIRAGGRIASLSGTTCIIDSSFNIESGKTYQIIITQIDGTLFTSNITNSPGSYTSLTLSSSSTVGVNNGAMFTISEDDLEPTKWMVISINADTSSGSYSISAVQYDESKYDYIEKNIALQPTNPSLYNNFISSQVNNISVSVNNYVDSTTTVYQVSVGWDELPGAYTYEYKYLPPSGNYTALVKTSNNYFDFTGEQGPYTFQVRAYDLVGHVTKFSTYTVTVSNSLIPIPDVQNFTSARQSQDVIFSWDPVDSTLLKNYEIRKGTNWSTAHVVATPSTTSCTVSEPDGSTFLIKAYSYYGAYSSDSAETTCLPVTNQYIEYDKEEKDESWPGTMVNMFVNGSGNLESDDVDTCSYTTEAIDLGEVLTARLAITTSIDAERDMSLEDFWTLYPTLGSIPTTTTLGGDPNAVSATFSISTSNDGSTWTPFVSYFPGFKKYRYIKVKITFTRSDGSVVPELSSMYMKWDLLAISQQKNGFAVADTGTTFTFSSVSNPVVYSRQAAVVAAVQNGDPGDTVHVVSNLTEATFTIYDATLTAKPGTINFSITGF